MNEYKIGDFVRYKIKNKIGLVGEVFEVPSGIKLRCWWHMGDTRAVIDTKLVERLSMEEVLNEVFVNEYVKPSLLERKRRLQEGGDISDLIDEWY